MSLVDVVIDDPEQAMTLYSSKDFSMRAGVWAITKSLSATHLDNTFEDPDCEATRVRCSSQISA